jgi:hypothetical protein
MGAEADAVCVAPTTVRPQPGPGQPAQRLPDPGLRHPGRHDATRIPKLRTGSYFPDWLLERRRRAEAALVTVAATRYLLGVSTRRIERLGVGSHEHGHGHPAAAAASAQHSSRTCRCLSISRRAAR